MIAGEALQLSSSSQKPLTKVLREETFETPLGSISFVQFGGYVQQCTLSPVIQKVEKGAISTVYPPDRVFDVVEKAQPGTPTQEIKSSFLKTLFDNQFIALFGILALGLLLGNVRVWGVSLGNSGVLFTALLFGHFHFTIPAGVGTLGLILFIYCVGISAGPSFFAAFRKQGANLAKLSILIVSAASLCTVWMAWLFKVPADLAVGILAGSLTSTPALAAAMDTLKDLGTNVSVGYGIAYPFGVIGVVLFVQLLPRLLGKDLDQLAATLEDAGKSGKSIQAVLVEVTNESIVGKSIEECAFIANTHCRISRRLMGEQLVPVQYDTCFEKGQVLRVVGREKELAGVIEFLGKKVDLPHVQDSRDYDVMELVVTNREFAGKMLGELQLLKRFGVTITRIKRNEVEFVPRMENKIDLQDVIRVVGDPEGIKQVAAECGHKARALQETDLVSLFVGLLLGVVLGLLPISIAGARNFTFGLSGGVLFVALLLGHFGRVGRVVGRMPFAARMLLMELGLVFFLANAGVRAGGSFMQVVGVHGVQLFLVGAVVTLVPMIAGFIFSTYFLKMDLLRTLGGICGGMTSTPALGAIKSKTDSGLPVVSYAAAYPVALILMLVAAQLVIFVLKLL
ncbi:MAG: YidE/YbjL duplication [Candidatus Omnitrophica bacterium]|nr:YidE/YbjL duplication [Candidatus Omnitrophota bacterium]